MRSNKAISTAVIVTLIVTIIIVVAIGAYATISIIGSNTQTSITCSESETTFTVSQNGAAQSVNASIPAAPCQHQISLSGFTLTAVSTTQSTITGTIGVNSHSSLTTLILYVNGTYELYNVFSQNGASSYSMQYHVGIANSTIAIIAGMSYNVEFVALFRDGTATTATTIVTATN